MRPQDQLGASLFGLGQTFTLSGDRAKGRPLMAEGLAVRRRLAAANPTDAELQRDLAMSLRVLARVEGSGVSWRDVAAQLAAMDHAGLLAPADRPWLDEAIAHAGPGSQP